jgi:REP element-mobilizing transposase RayT
VLWCDVLCKHGHPVSRRLCNQKISAIVEVRMDTACYGAHMTRVRIKHDQLALPVGDKNGQRRGRRPGDPRWKRAVRPKKERAGSPHKARPELQKGCAVHVVLRVHGDVGSLRKRHMYKALREATLTVARREQNFAEQGAFRIVHVSIQRNHVHLLVEADGRVTLSRAMQSFQISAAKHINREFSLRARLVRRRRGSVFPDRFHQEIITSPRQARNALSYVLNNWRKHEEDRSGAPRTWNVDPFSTGVLFDGWRQRSDEPLMWRLRDTYDPMFVYRPKTWLLREGWRRHGLISFHEVPGS